MTALDAGSDAMSEISAAPPESEALASDIGACPVTGDSCQPKLYSQLFEVLADGLLVHCAGEVTYANDAAARLWAAASPKDLLGRRSIDLVAETSRDAVNELLNEVAGTGTAGRSAPTKSSVATELRRRSKDIVLRSPGWSARGPSPWSAT